MLKGAPDSDQLIAFLKRLKKDAKRNVLMILDNLRVYHARLVKAWLAKYQEEIEVFYGLNPNFGLTNMHSYHCQ